MSSIRFFKNLTEIKPDKFSSSVRVQLSKRIFGNTEKVKKA
jgi:hypothetical protein